MYLGTQATDLASLRKHRQQVRARHPQLESTLAVTLPPAENLDAWLQQHSVKNHPRWDSLKAGYTPKAVALQNHAANLDQVEVGEDVSRVALGPNYIPEDQTLRNDYSQYFVDSGAGRLPGNAVRNPGEETRFDEYPKLKRLVQVKDSLVTSVAHPPTYLCADLKESLVSFTGPSHRQSRHSAQGSQTHSSHSSRTPSASQTPQNQAIELEPDSTIDRSDANKDDSANSISPASFHLTSLTPIKYDVVLIDPPLETYEWEATPNSAPSAGRPWTWDEIAALPVPQVAAKESFVFLWVGSGAGDGLERGREVLSRWGYRRCEDIVWVRTNPQASPEQSGDSSAEQPSTSSALTRCVQHCLMGIRGTVRRSTDTRFVHCNIDTDVILWPGEQAHASRLPASESTLAGQGVDIKSKPPEMYQLIENFCLGTRRIELFGRNRNLRRGWLTVGLELGPEHPGWPAEGRVGLPKPGLSLVQLDAERLESLQQPREYIKTVYDSHFGVDRPGCELKDRINLIPFSEETELLRPKSPPPRGSRIPHGSGGIDPSVSGMPLGLSSNPMLRGAGYHDASTPIFVPPSRTMPPTGTAPLYMRPNPGGAGLSGLGAGGPRTVSVPSGSETLSGPQANVLKAKAAAEAAIAAAAVQSDG